MRLNWECGRRSECSSGKKRKNGRKKKKKKREIGYIKKEEKKRKIKNGGRQEKEVEMEELEREEQRGRERKKWTHTHTERERERERGSQQKNHFLCSRWNSGKSRGSQPMLVNSVGRITTALFWMMTLYNDHDAILFYLLSNTYCCCLYFYCPTVEA